MAKNNYKAIVSIVFICLFIIFVKNNLSIFRKLLDLNILELVILSFFQIAQLLSVAYVFKVVMQAFKIKLRIFEWFGLTVLGRFANHLINKSGVITKALYLKKKHHFKYRKLFFVLLYVTYLQVVAASLIAISLLCYFYFKEGIFYPSLSILFLGTILVVVVLYLFKNKIFNFLSSRFCEFETANIDVLKFSLFSQILFFSIVSFLIYGMRIYLFFIFLSEPIRSSQALLISIIGFLSTLLSVTPGGIGVKEALMSLTFKIIGGDFSMAILISSIDRVLLIFLISILSLYYSKKLFVKN